MYQRNLSGDPLVQDFVGKVLAIPDRNRLLKWVLSIEDGTTKHSARGDFPYLSALRHFSGDVNSVSRFLMYKRFQVSLAFHRLRYAISCTFLGYNFS